MRCSSSACVPRRRGRSTRCCKSPKKPSDCVTRQVGGPGLRPTPSPSYASNAGDQDLHQYAVYDTKEGTTPSKGPRIINLDDTKGKDKMMREYTPPTSLTIHLSKIDMPELLPRGRSPQATRHDQDSRKQKEPSKRGKDKDKAKDKDKNTDRQGSRPKRPSLPETHSTPPHPTMLRKYRTQYFHPTAPAGASHQVPPLPPRMPATGTRQSMYGTLSGDLSPYPYQGVTHPGSGATPTSGLLGRFLGR